MPTLQSSGAISINDIKNLFGGPASPALSNYYRGGSYIPSTKTVSTLLREPTTGENYSGQSGAYVWRYITTGSKDVVWNNVIVANPIYSTDTSITVGAYTYYRGTLMYSSQGAYGTWNYYYGVYRTSGSSSTVNINTNIPTSGAISLSQFYGAEKP